MSLKVMASYLYVPLDYAIPSPIAHNLLVSHGAVHHAEDPLLPRVAVLTHIQTQPGLVLGQGEAPA